MAVNTWQISGRPALRPAPVLAPRRLVRLHARTHVDLQRVCASLCRP
ncbi:hypothetical protein ACFZBM_19590 [Streptomyces lavendulae]|uniref:Uncharacterized protein n=1 Tax=Streptomyces lavendulae subsp. lavendulae TaxID=58340 RepID=A0A2K8PMD1_STRLA|nr:MULTISPECIES: hypothetical protein [Streptomyces]ATZ27864.1 hypothetical protein SLAV_30435 [Streptomyces lavendulae subsp. lavendulae]MDH6539060.1 hypothetical protein [Streptomyces sp. SPB4]QUQ57691.1 hypothetical protein SLLC_28590 [Streptomyces lavendulae subsp. lavendulae]